jgi:hypothetical protein
LLIFFFFFLWWGWGVGVLMNYLPGLAPNLDPPDLCLLSGQDYRCKPLVPGCFLLTFNLTFLL